MEATTAAARRWARPGGRWQPGFFHLQPYLYWACAGNQSPINCSGDPAARGFQFSFSFGNGFQGTDVIGNSLYVMVYAVDRKR